MKSSSEPQSSSPSSPPRRNALNPYDRELPHDADAERALLGSMLLEEAAIGEAISVLAESAADAFFFERHRRLYGHIVELWKASRPLDGVVIKDELIRAGLFEQLGGYDFLGELVSAVPSALRVREYAALVRDKYLLRQLINATHNVMEFTFEGRETTSSILDRAEKEIFEVTERRVSSGCVALPDLIEEAFKRLENLDGEMLTGEPTGFYELDELTCGLQPAELIIVAGRPSMGKTALGLNMAEHMALVEDPPRPVLFFSLEMSRQQVAQRILCSRARVDAQRLRRGRHTPRDMEALLRAAEVIRSRPLFIDDTSSLSILELRARARMAFRKHRIRAILVDYLQLMHTPGAESRQQEVAEISRGLKSLAKDLNVPVIAMAQLNRNPEDRTGNRPRMSDLRESGAIEQDADVVLLLHREAYYTQPDESDPEAQTKAELIIAKQRNGPVDTVELHFDKRFTRFGNPHRGTQYANVAEASSPG